MPLFKSRLEMCCFNIKKLAFLMRFERCFRCDCLEMSDYWIAMRTFSLLCFCQDLHHTLECFNYRVRTISSDHWFSSLFVKQRLTSIPQQTHVCVLMCVCRPVQDSPAHYIRTIQLWPLAFCIHLVSPTAYLYLL